MEIKHEIKVAPKCSQCWKTEELCLCAEVESLATRTEILILQHPQEARNPLTTARLASCSLSKCTHKVGLNWRSLSAALGKPAEPKQWAVLFLGTIKGIENLKQVPFQVVTQKGEPVSKKSIKGIVVLDGNWKQSKTLWWRNAWLLKLQRIVLNPPEASQWKGLRKQPRKNCLSTIESLSFTLSQMDEAPKVSANLSRIFQRHVEVANPRKAPPTVVPASEMTLS